MNLSMALFQRCSCCGSSQFTWYYLLIIIRYNQLLIEEKFGKINVSDRNVNPKINLVVSMQLVNKLMGVHKGHLLKRKSKIFQLQVRILKEYLTNERL